MAGRLEKKEERGTPVAEEEEGVEEAETGERREDEDEDEGAERRGCKGLRIRSFCAQEAISVEGAAGVDVDVPPFPSQSLLTPLSYIFWSYSSPSPSFPPFFLPPLFSTCFSFFCGDSGSGGDPPSESVPVPPAADAAPDTEEAARTARAAKTTCNVASTFSRTHFKAFFNSRD